MAGPSPSLSVAAGEGAVVPPWAWDIPGGVVVIPPSEHLVGEGWQARRRKLRNPSEGRAVNGGDGLSIVWLAPSSIGGEGKTCCRTWAGKKTGVCEEDGVGSGGIHIDVT